MEADGRREDFIIICVTTDCKPLPTGIFNQLGVLYILSAARSDTSYIGTSEN